MRLEDIKLTCPICSRDRVVARTRKDNYDRDIIYLACEACEHELSYEEIGEQVARQIATQTDHSDLDFPEGGG
jgi:transcription elongation factor Elf1